MKIDEPKPIIWYCARCGLCMPVHEVCADCERVMNQLEPATVRWLERVIERAIKQAFITHELSRHEDES